MESDKIELSPAHQKALKWIMAEPKKLWIGGKWVEAKSGQTLETLNPSTEDCLTHLAAARAEEGWMASGPSRGARKDNPMLR